MFNGSKQVGGWGSEGSHPWPHIPEEKAHRSGPFFQCQNPNSTSWPSPMLMTGLWLTSFISRNESDTTLAADCTDRPSEESKSSAWRPPPVPPFEMEPPVPP